MGHVAVCSDRRAKKGLSPVTSKKEIASFRACWNWAVHGGLIEIARRPCHCLCAEFAVNHSAGGMRSANDTNVSRSRWFFSHSAFMASASATVNTISRMSKTTSKGSTVRADIPVRPCVRWPDPCGEFARSLTGKDQPRKTRNTRKGKEMGSIPRSHPSTVLIPFSFLFRVFRVFRG